MSTEDEYGSRLRGLAGTAVPGAPVSGEQALGIVRRAGHRRRARNAVTGAGLAAALVVGGTVGVPALRDADQVPALTAAASSAPAAPDLTPIEGVQLMDPGARTYERADGRTVVDTGLGSWADGERFLLAVAPGTGGSAGRIDVYSGDDVALASLVDAPAAPAPVWTVPETGSAVLVSPDEGRALVLGSMQRLGEPDLSLLLQEPFATAGDVREWTVPVLLSRVETGAEFTHADVTFAGSSLWALTLDVASGTVPELYGVLSSDGDGNGGVGGACFAAECVATWDGSGPATAGPERLTVTPATLDLPGQEEALAAMARATDPDQPFALPGELCLEGREAWEREAGIRTTARDRAALCVVDRLTVGFEQHGMTITL
ncbi:hypothetical protein [Cellulosimicrobium protaetiae]|uniref:Uncharacterized protein n=1 Tax=Cellulosimicrobium protaetiae TaxID=2587808 RepID=A0A6M5UBR5_9MICO|nr:hypothetical protein [Cellulosimicrobium protaetiae]QJW35544.1 hypothetical protein FIC82_004325 [Cellulosimicrobium protaetiae]